MPKRFYKVVEIGAHEGGYHVLLDGKPLRTPARHRLSIPSEALARAVADEWAVQADEVVTDAMPLMRLATTAVDLFPARRIDAIEEVQGYAQTDMLCYRADRPAELAARQAAAWQKWLDWAQLHLDARLTVTVGVLPVRQDDEALAALRRSVEGLEDWRLVGLHAATTLTGSIVLGLALSRGALGTEEAFASSVLDELYEIELWGAEEEQTRRHQRLRRDLAAVEAFFAALD